MGSSDHRGGDEAICTQKWRTILEKSRWKDRERNSQNQSQKYRRSKLTFDV